MLDGGDHQVADILGGDAASGGDVSHGFPATAVEREGDADLLAVVATDLQRIGPPAGIAPVDSDATVVAPFLALAAMGLEQQAMNLRHAVCPLWIGRCASGLLCPTAQQGMNPPIAVGR